MNFLFLVSGLSECRLISHEELKKTLNDINLWTTSAANKHVHTTGVAVQPSVSSTHVKVKPHLFDNYPDFQHMTNN